MIRLINIQAHRVLSRTAHGVCLLHWLPQRRGENFQCVISEGNNL